MVIGEPDITQSSKFKDIDCLALNSDLEVGKGISFTVCKGTW